MSSHDERERRPSGADRFQAVDPSTGQAWGPTFTDATDSEVDTAVSAAHDAASLFAATSLLDRAGLLRAVADHLEADADGIVSAAHRETALGEDRLSGELGRTKGQLRLFADIVEDGSYVAAIIDRADDGRPDLRRMTVPIGPIAMFGSSNFPLAFSVPGGDTASALAAGCPVVVKAHPSHPNTSERCATAVRRAIADAGLPDGTFGMVHGTAHRVGRRLVEAEGIAAVAFTGSLGGGRAVFDMAARRPVPIPVYAEMGSLNPVLVTPAAARARTREIAEGFVGSMTMGTGQFCTKPGLLFLVDDEAGRELEQHIAGSLSEVALGCLLNPSIADRFQADTEALRGMHEVAQIATTPLGTPDGLRGEGVVFAVEAGDLASLPPLTEEHFGPLSIVVRCESVGAMANAVAALPGSLVAAVHTAGDEGTPDVADLQRILLDRVGRLVYNGWPTGVSVTHAQHHGGPYPATTSPLHTSVGSTAMRRFLRPVAFQDAPADVLPPALRDDNPLRIWRMVDGRLTRDPI